MILFIPSSGLSPEDQIRLQREVTRDWFLYGEVHLTNMGGQGIAIIDPRGVKYSPDLLADEPETPVSPS